MAVTFKAVLASGGTALTILFTTSDTSLYGQTITISKNGTTVGTTAFDNTGNASYTVREAGTYDVVCGAASDSVTVQNEYPVELSAIPDGSTVTPVNDIQTWLNCAGIFNKTTYTTISDVLADTTTLLALINSQNAVDYMVRSHAWCDDVCADATAMTYIGANNYAADTLLADSNEGLVPIMTSDTTPNGEAFYSSGNSSYPAWKAFDGDNSTFANFTNAVDEYIGYEFPSAVVVKHIDIIGEASSGTEFYIEGANSKTGTYTPLGTFTGTTGSLKGIDVNNSTAYKSYRLRIKTKAESWNRFATYTIQFYAKDGSWLESICNSTYFESVLNVKIPTLTSNSQCIASSYYSGSTYETYKMFDENISTIGTSNQNYSNPSSLYFGYDFTRNVKIYKVKYVNSQYTGSATFKLQGSADNSTYYDVGDNISITAASQTKDTSISNPTSYRCWRIKYSEITSSGGSYAPNLCELQFYGREE